MDKSLLNTPEFYDHLRQSDLGAFAMLYDHFSGAVFGEVSRAVNDHFVAEKILHDTFKEIYDNLNQFDPDRGRLYTWIISIARNKCIDHFRGTRFHDGE